MKLFGQNKNEFDFYNIVTYACISSKWSDPIWGSEIYDCLDPVCKLSRMHTPAPHVTTQQSLWDNMVNEIILTRPWKWETVENVRIIPQHQSLRVQKAGVGTEALETE